MKQIGECTDGKTCPGLFEDEMRYVVRGKLVDAAADGIELGPGEVAVEVPKYILDAIAKG